MGHQYAGAKKGGRSTHSPLSIYDLRFRLEQRGLDLAKVGHHRVVEDSASSTDRDFLGTPSACDTILRRNVLSAVCILVVRPQESDVAALAPRVPPRIPHKPCL